MEVPLGEVVYFDVITSSPTTGAVTDADSTPTFEVFEEATDTDIGVGGNLTKRTSKTGNYRGTFTASTANGFEVGKWYNVIASATVGTIAGKCRAKIFRCAGAEVTAGYRTVDLAYVGDSSVTGPAGTTSIVFPATVASPTNVDAQLSSAHGSGNWESELGVPDVNVVTIAGSTCYDPAGTVGITFPSSIASSAGSGLDAAGVRAAVGLATANLDSQFTTVTGKTNLIPASPASTTNITAGTITTVTTVTNLTNLPAITSNWLTATGIAADAITVDNGKRCCCSKSSLNLCCNISSDLSGDLLDSEVAAIKAKTDLIPGSPAAVGSAMTLAAGAITDATITLPAEVTGFATTFFTKFLQLFNKFLSKTTHDKVGNTIVTTKADGTTTATTQAVTSNATNDIVDKAS